MSVTPIDRIAFSKLPSLRAFTQNNRIRSSLSTGMLRLGVNSPNALIIHNDSLCNANAIITSLNTHKIDYKIIYAFHDNVFETLHPLNYEAIIILGCKTDIISTEPKWLTKEIAFISNALKLNIPIIGIGLGCLLLAKCCGGNILIGKKGIEIGYKTWIYENIQNMNTTSNNKNKKEENITTFFNLSLPELTSTEINESKTENTFHQLTLRDSDIIKHNQLKYIGQSKSTPVIIGSITKMNQYNFNEINDEKKNDFNEDDFNENEFNEDEFYESDESYDFIEDDINDNLDPFIDVLACENMDKYILLFHNYQFELPKKCIMSKKDINILAKTNKYNTFFRIGTCSYGILGMPYLNSQMLKVFCKSWDDKLLDEWNGNLDKDIILYTQKIENKIKSVYINLFNIWCNDVVLAMVNSKQKSFKSLSVSFH